MYSEVNIGSKLLTELHLNSDAHDFKDSSLLIFTVCAHLMFAVVVLFWLCLILFLI